jgi:aromatic-L-amino-acid decarboxylase
MLDFPTTAPDAAETGRLAEAVGRLLPSLEAFQRFEGLDPAARNRAAWQHLDRPLPTQGLGLDAVLQELAEVVIPHGDRTGMPGFTGWVVNAPTTSGTAAALSGIVAGSQRWGVQPYNLLELVGLRWLAELLGLPAEWQGVFVSGGSIANLIGLGAARQHAFERIGCDPTRDGLPLDRRGRVYASSEVHHCVMRACAVLGLGRRGLVEIPPDREGRADVDAIARVVERDVAEGIVPVAVVGSAGTVNAGAVDDLAGLADVADQHGAWLHVDGAYGLWGLLDEEVAPLFAGLERAGSVAVDPHKWLATPIGVGAAFVRDRALLARAFTQEPSEYIEGAIGTGEPVSPFDALGEEFHNYTIELSASARGLLVWAALAEMGADGMRARVRRHNGYARRLAALVRADERLELVLEPTLSICCFRYAAPGLDEARLAELNEAIAAGLRAEDIVPSTTTVAGKVVIRPCYINPRTQEADVDALAAAVRRLGDELVAA